ncbi:MAG: cobalamin-binding protein [Proteobacteria bacterium]|nr:cobalamin-binding protein [Pseudomonadota bacterium]
MTAHRIVSLLPSTTEIVCALGLRDQLVGRSHECDHPPDVAGLTVCSSAQFDDGSSRQIDDRVKDLVRRGLSLYEVDAEKLRGLEPSLILTQDQCEVCAVQLADVEAAVCDWVGPDTRVVSLSPQTLGDVWGDIRRVGDAAGVPDRAGAVAAALADRVSLIGEQTGALARRPRVACIEWLDPLMSAGNWIPELVRLAGGEAVLATPGAHSPWIEPKALAEADPDLIVVMPCGFDLPRTRAELPAWSAQPEFRALRAARENRVFLTDGNAYFSRPGPRLVESLEILAEILHPDRFAFGHRDRGFALADD